MYLCRFCKTPKEEIFMVKRANLCKDCKNEKRRTGLPAYRFPKGVLSSPNPFVKGHTPWNKGVPVSAETKIKMSISLTGRKMPIGSFEKRNAANRTSTRRKSYKYNEWSRLVKERDNFKCQHCGLDDIIRLQSHHIVPWEDCVELRFELSNGMTLCRVCHTKEDRRIKPKVAWNKGKKLSAEHRANLSKSHKGNIPWNKGK